MSVATITRNSWRGDRVSPSPAKGWGTHAGGADMRQVFGKYRGKVVNNVDPLQLGRVQVSSPDALGEGRLGWAMPCVPYAGPGVGFFAVPPVGANVWVECEGGNPDRPIWSGCFWGSGEVPVLPAVAQAKVLKTDGVKLTPVSVLVNGGGPEVI